MIRRLRLLFSRYRSAHLVMRGTTGPIRDSSGKVIGHVDLVEQTAGRFRVAGWTEAQRVRLVFGDAEIETTPSLRREDVARALGLSETLGFDLTLPLRLEDVLREAPPGLIFTAGPGQPEIPSLSLAFPRGARAQARTGLAFLRDLGLATPAILGWLATRDPAFRKRVKARLRLEHVVAAGPLDPALYFAPNGGTDKRSPEPALQRVTIVLPVYNAFELLQEALDRVERHTDLPWQLLLIEDGSTDDRVRPFLRRWAADPARAARVELMENPQNLGFIRSVNRGLERARQIATEKPPEPGVAEGPVVLLNSDALVPAGWASRLVRPFALQKNVATVTPMSNDAEIFSVPVICTRFILLPGQADQIDQTAQRFRAEAAPVEAPVGVGFCMAMGRDWLSKPSQLDTAFGRGYGEEVDWCRKVTALGGRHLCQAGLFVEHRGGASFGSAEKRALVAQNNRLIESRYPGYDRTVQDYIAADPLRTPRLALGIAWAGSLEPDQAVPVYLAHSLGGGADHALEYQIARDLRQGRPSVILRVGGAMRWQVELVAPVTTPDGRLIEGRSTGQTDRFELVEALVDALPRRRVVYSCGVGDPDPVELPALLGRLLRDGDEAELLFHDYFPLSPAYTLLDSDGAYRGAPLPPRTDRAHRVRRPDGSEVSLAQWQTAWEGLAARASRLRVFSQDSARQVAAVWPHLSDHITLSPHEMPRTLPQIDPPAGCRPVIGVLGNIGFQKGAGVLQALSRRLAARPGAPGLVVLGNLDPAFSLAPPARVHGSYKVEDIPALARRYGISHWLIPSIWPETFCFTVQEALSTGLPVLAFGIGAQGDAVRQAANGVEMPFDLGSDLAETVDTALARLS